MLEIELSPCIGFATLRRLNTTPEKNMNDFFKKYIILAHWTKNKFNISNGIILRIKRGFFVVLISYRSYLYIKLETMKTGP